MVICLKQLEFLDLHSDALTGPLPTAAIGGIESLTFIDLDFNAFDGTIPTSISNWSNIQDAVFSNNNYTSEVPTGICQFNATILNLIADCDVASTCCTRCGGRAFAWQPQQKERHEEHLFCNKN
jgi:hypothetical protein